MSTHRVILAHLLPGDVVVSTGEIVEGIQVLGPITIVDFTNRTATPPLPSNGWTEVRRNAQGGQS